jgi:hypothetical protein
MKTESRGFNQYVGKTIESVDESSINVVKLTFTDDTVYEIWAEDRHLGIEIISTNIVEKNLTP